MRKNRVIKTAVAQTAKPTFQEAREQYQALIFAFVSRRIRPPEEAEDIVAHVFVDAYRQWGRLRGPAKPWLLGIARRKVCDALRKQRNWTTLRDTDLQANALAGFMEAADVQDAVRIVMRLPEAQRDAFLMQVLEGLTIEEIAQVMSRSVASANSLLQRARAHIQKATSNIEEGTKS